MADVSMSVGACGVVIALLLKKRYRRQSRNRKVWVREWVKNRQRFGAYHQLVQELRLADTSTYRNFLRMDVPTFDELLKMVGPLITYQDTNMRQAISPRERLALTLRFLATGESYSSLQYLYRIPAQTIGKIIPKTCAAIVQVPSNKQNENVRQPSSNRFPLPQANRFIFSSFNTFFAELVITVDDAVEKLGFGAFQIIVTVFAGSLWLADAMELMLLSILSPAVKCQWDLSTGEEAAITSVVFLGFLIGAFFWGAMCDLIGRKPGLFLVNLTILIFGVLSAIPISSNEYDKLPGYPWLLVCRCGVGFGAGGTTQAVTYYTEFLPKKLRGLCLTFQEVWWVAGSMLGAGLAVGVMVPGGLGWHWYLGLSTIPLFLVLPLFLIVPESARYYIIKGKPDKAAAVIKTIAKYNCKPVPEGRLVSFEEKKRIDKSKSIISGGEVILSEGNQKLEEEPLLDETAAMEDHDNSIPKAQCESGYCLKTKQSLLQLRSRASLMFRDRMWITTSILFLLWFGSAWVYYGIVLLTTQFLQHDPHCGVTLNMTNLTCEETRLDREDYLYILWTSVAELPGLLVTFALIEIIGRRFTIASEFIFTMFGFLLLFICSSKIVLSLFLFIIRAFATGVFQAIYVYTPEVYPTSVRSFALGSCSAFARIGAILTPYIAQVLVEHSDIATISLYAGSCLVFSVLACLLPIETKGRSLQDESNR